RPGVLGRRVCGACAYFRTRITLVAAGPLLASWGLGRFPGGFPAKIVPLTMIKLDHVTKVYKDSVVALDDVCVDIQKGEFVFVVGPSGSGKSTLIRLLIREEEPSRGEIHVAGKNIANLTSWKVPYP